MPLSSRSHVEQSKGAPPSPPHFEFTSSAYDNCELDLKVYMLRRWSAEEGGK